MAKPMMRVIYNGLERCDFLYYLSCILSVKSAKVIVNDTSISHDLFEAASRNSQDNIHEWRNLVFTKDLVESESNFDQNDVYIEYRGMNVMNEDTEELVETFHLVMPDYTHQGMRLVEDVIPEGNSLYIFRDLSTNKITDKSYALSCDLKKDDVLGHLALSVEDMASYVALTHNGHQKFNKCSDDMKAALCFITGIILDIKKEKETQRVLKEALRKMR